MTKNKAPGAADFLAAAKAQIARREVALPSMKMTAVAHGLTVDEIDAITHGCLVDPDKPVTEDNIDSKKQLACIVAASIRDETGARLVPEGREHELRDLPHHIYGPLQQAALAVNGMTEEDIEGNA